MILEIWSIFETEFRGSFGLFSVLRNKIIEGDWTQKC